MDLSLVSVQQTPVFRHSTSTSGLHGHRFGEIRKVSRNVTQPIVIETGTLPSLKDNDEIQKLS